MKVLFRRLLVQHLFNTCSASPVIDDTNKKELYLVMEDLPGPIQYDDDAKGPPVYSVSQIRRIIRDVTLGLDFCEYRTRLGCPGLTIAPYSSAPLCASWLYLAESISNKPSRVSFIATSSPPIF